MKKSIRSKWIEVGGWIGVALIVAAYAAINFDVTDPENIIYLSANIVGSVLVGIDAYTQKNYQPVALQIVWIAVSLIALIRVLEVVV